MSDKMSAKIPSKFIKSLDDFLNIYRYISANYLHSIFKQERHPVNFMQGHKILLNLVILVILCH